MRRIQGPPGPRERARLVARLAQPPADAARALLGCILTRRVDGRQLAARIVETEAYLGPGDPASHAHAGRTRRTEPLWGEPGTLYVYVIYGIHHCLNVAVDESGIPGCVLVRAAEPLSGSGLADGACRGPGRLCRALAIDTRLSGRHLFERRAPLSLREGETPRCVAVSRRIGIRRAASRPLRFYDADSPAVSARSGPGVSSFKEQPRSSRPRVAHAPKRGKR